MISRRSTGERSSLFVSVTPCRAGAGPLCVPVALVGQVGARESTSDNQLRVAPVDCLLPPAAPGTLGPVILDPAVYTRSPPPAPPPSRPDRTATETRTYIVWTNSSTSAVLLSPPLPCLPAPLSFPVSLIHPLSHAYTQPPAGTDTHYLNPLRPTPSSLHPNIFPLIFTSATRFCIVTRTTEGNREIKYAPGYLEFERSLPNVRV